MKKTLVLVCALLLLTSVLFASGLYISADANLLLPMKGWENSNLSSNKFEDADLSNKIVGGGFTELGVGYEFNEVLRLGLRSGVGFNDTATENTITTIPLVLDLNVRMFSINELEFRAGLMLGGYGRIYNKVLSLGPSASLDLGFEAPLTEHFTFGFSSRVNTLFDLYNNFKGMNIELNFVPINLSVKYIF